MEIANKKAFIFRELLDRLFAGRYRFGERISVKDLSEELGVSKQPVMTALTSLQERGFVRITAQVGCEVISPTPDEIQDFYRMFAAVEGVIASLAARRATGDEIGRLAEINHQLTAVPPDSSPADVYRQINVLFHRQLHDMAHSSLVSARQQANFELSDFFIVQTCGFDAHLHLVAEEHQVLIDAISARDSERAAIMAQAHILSVSDSVASYLHVQRAQ
ncbi:MAG TPA: GntR family transcriptional regulator [Thauera sp.]|nr:GntR family transcriptional regulator [Thauera sp.]HHW62977.1 GntR family transcriptional regulator [Rhodocyclaceae bacterium]